MTALVGHGLEVVAEELGQIVACREFFFECGFGFFAVKAFVCVLVGFQLGAYGEVEH